LRAAAVQLTSTTDKDRNLATADRLVRDAADQIGDHGHGMRSGGRSMIVDPWGVVLAMAPDRECAIVADLDLQLLDDIRRRLPSLAHRRPQELYA